MRDNSIATDRGSTLKIGEAFETTLTSVFAAGDAVSGPATVIEAVAQGNKVALGVDIWLQTGKLEKVVYRPKWHKVAQFVRLEDYADARRARPRVLGPDQRKSFEEVEAGFDEVTAQEEARRCLRCDLEWLQRIGEALPEG